MIDPKTAVQQLQCVPYLRGGRTMAGADCFGIIELWYRMVLDIELTDRGSIPPGHAGIDAGVAAMKDWRFINSAADHCLVLMREKAFHYGHIGVFWQGSVLHSDEHAGCVFEPIGRRFLKSKITGFLQHHDHD